MRRLSALALFLWLALPSLALAATTESGEEEFNPEHDFEIGEWIPIGVFMTYKRYGHAL